MAFAFDAATDKGRASGRLPANESTFDCTLLVTFAGSGSGSV